MSELEEAVTQRREQGRVSERTSERDWWRQDESATPTRSKSAPFKLQLPQTFWAPSPRSRKVRRGPTGERRD